MQWSSKAGGVQKLLSARYSIRVLLVCVAGAACMAWCVHLDAQRFRTSARIEAEWRAHGAAFEERFVRPAWARAVIGPSYGKVVTALRIGDQEDCFAGPLLLPGRLAAHATSLSSLEYLSICNARVEGSSLHLKSLPLLRGLSLAGTNVSDSDLAELRGADNLVVLDLCATGTTDRAIDFARSLADLRFLGLAGTAVSDQGIAVIANHASLEYLQLNATAVTDASVQSFAAMPALRILEIGDTRVTAAGKEQLKELRPELRFSLFD